jgi:hypothetical protein
VTVEKSRELTFVLCRKGLLGAVPVEHRVTVPNDAGFSELLRELKRVAPAIYEALREQIIRSASQVLAFGKTDEFVPLMLSGLADGSRIILSTDEDAPSTALTLGEA